MAGEIRAQVQRSDRKPLYVQVLTEPALRGCWSVNVSETGIGLIASPASAAEGPHEGDDVVLEWTLPGARTRLRAHGKVRWRHDAKEPREGASTALGIQFTKFDGQDRVRLVRYLWGHRVKVVVANATRDAEAQLKRAVQDDFELLYVGSDDEVDLALSRGDVSAFVVFGTQATRALATAERLLGAASEAERPADVSPPLVLWSPARPERLVELFNSGRLYRALAPGCTAEELREAIAGACRQYGMRIEQQRMALELERHYARVRQETQSREPGAPQAQEAGFGSPPMRRVISLVQKVAPHRVAVLLQGETGTGKEVLARTVHRLSGRKGGAFVVQDCGALPETLLESELFGHVRGAFTGAVADHPGLFVLADGGTIFLDEIENTTANLQAKLLRVIETGEVRPVGGSAVRQVDVRLVAASNRDLEEEVRAGRFRSDLFFRLNTFVIDVPPLRERQDDVLPLARLFLRQFGEAMKRRVKGLSAEAEALLQTVEWRGNIRELRNVMERAVLLCADGAEVTPAEFPDALVARAMAGTVRQGPRTFTERMAEAERNVVREALERSDGVLRRAAQELDMDPVTLGRRAQKLGLWRKRRATA